MGTTLGLKRGGFSEYRSKHKKTSWTWWQHQEQLLHDSNWILWGILPWDATKPYSYVMKLHILTHNLRGLNDPLSNLKHNKFLCSITQE